MFARDCSLGSKHSRAGKIRFCVTLLVVVMDEDLVKLLTAPKPKGWALHEDVVAGILENKITSIPMFAKCVDSEKELKPAFLTPTAQANSMAEASKLKLAWEAACTWTRCTNLIRLWHLQPKRTWKIASPRSTPGMCSRLQWSGETLCWVELTGSSLLPNPACSALQG